MRILCALDPLPNDVELLVFDDTSSDELRDIVHRFSTTMSGLRYRHNPSAFGAPLGAGANWNALLDAARGKYVVLMHHDEVPLDKRFISLLRPILTAPSSPDVVMLDLLLVDELLRPLRRHVPDWLRHAVPHYASGYLFRRNVIGPTATLVIRREVAPRFDPMLRWLIDVDFYVQLCRAGLSWLDARNIRIGSVQRDTGTITSELAGELSSIEAIERQKLIKRYPQDRIWLNANVGTPIRALEMLLWFFLKGSTMIQSKFIKKV